MDESHIYNIPNIPAIAKSNSTKLGWILSSHPTCVGGWQLNLTKADPSSHIVKYFLYFRFVLSQLRLK